MQPMQRGPQQPGPQQLLGHPGAALEVALTPGEAQQLRKLNAVARQRAMEHELAVKRAEVALREAEVALREAAMVVTGYLSALQQSHPALDPHVPWNFDIEGGRPDVLVRVQPLPQPPQPAR